MLSIFFIFFIEPFWKIFFSVIKGSFSFRKEKKLSNKRKRKNINYQLKLISQEIKIYYFEKDCYPRCLTSQILFLVKAFENQFVNEVDRLHVAIGLASFRR